MKTPKPWHDLIPDGKSWTSLISDYVLCGCRGIRRIGKSCPACGATQVESQWIVVETPAGTRSVPNAIYAGAEGGIEDYQLLALMEREWRRAKYEPKNEGWLTDGMSQRATIVILFWTYFETRMQRLVELGLRQLPENVSKNLAARYDSVGSHMNQLYEILYGVTYLKDLVSVGTESIGGHIALVQDARNRFLHGDPSAISENLVQSVVDKLKDEVDTWVSVFNRRITNLEKNK